MSESSEGLKGCWTHFSAHNSPLPVNSVVTSCVAGKQNQVWMSVGIAQGIVSLIRPYGLFLTDGTDWFEFKLGEHRLPVETLGRMVVDSQNRLWLSIPSVGIYCFDGQSTVMYEYERCRFLTKDVTVTDLYVDELDRVWVATLGHGVYRLPNDVWERVVIEDKALSDRVLAFAVDRENHLWLACEDTKETRFLSNRTGTWELICSFPLGFKHKDEVVCFTVDRNEHLWVGRRWGGLMIWDGKNWNRLTQRNCSLLYGEIRSLTIDEFDNLWVGVGGFAIFDGAKWHGWAAIRPRRSQQPVAREDFLKISSGEASDYIYLGSHVAMDSAGRKWISAPRGIVMFTPEERR